MMTQRSIVSFAFVSLLVGASSVASAQGRMSGMTGMAGMQMGPEIVIPKGARFTKADVEFMQGMIAHHAQAIVMTHMAEAHGANPQVMKLSTKIGQSQVPEILIMQQWLLRNGQIAPDTASWHHMQMTGMLTAAQLKELDASKSVDFDRAFLTMMIQHHAGALTMVDDLFATPMAGQEVDVSVFANDVMTSQTGEIGIMRRLLTQLPSK